jgi:rhodanese-related sulfurtransferase
MQTLTPGPVTATPALPPAEAAARFTARLAEATDPADVAAHLALGGDPGFVLVDTRSPEHYAQGHLPGAVNLPWATIDAATAAALPRERLLVTYCWGVACNASTKGAARLATLGFAVKELTGGITEWRRERHPVVR